MAMQTNRVAIITGAAGGIGAKVAERLARDGLTVVVNYAGSAQAAEAVVREIEAAGGQAISAQADVSKSADVRRLFDTVQAVYGGVDVLVNNAGVIALANVADLKDEDFLGAHEIGKGNGFRILYRFDRLACRDPSEKRQHHSGVYRHRLLQFSFGRQQINGAAAIVVAR